MTTNNIRAVLIALAIASLAALGGCASTAQSPAGAQGDDPREGVSETRREARPASAALAGLDLASLQRDVEAVIAELQANRDGGM